MQLYKYLCDIFQALLAWVWPQLYATERVGEVSELVIFPVKGCAGVSVKQARIKTTGFYFDRHWVIVGADNVRFKNQKTETKLALVNVTLPTEAFIRPLDSLPRSATMALQTAGKSDLQIALAIDDKRLQGQDLSDCSVWEWTGKAWDEGDAAADWFSDLLGKPCRLMRYAGDIGSGSVAANPNRRPSDARFAKGFENAFADRWPFLLASEASLEDLNARMPKHVGMDRFRPNIIVAGAAPWAEDSWQRFEVRHKKSSITFRTIMPCDRCKVTTTDQQTAEVDEELREPLKCLEEFRSSKVLDWQGPTFHSKSVFFGWLTAAESFGEIAVGDPVHLRQIRRSAYRT